MVWPSHLGDLSDQRHLGKNGIGVAGEAPNGAPDEGKRQRVSMSWDNATESSRNDVRDWKHGEGWA